MERRRRRWEIVWYGWGFLGLAMARRVPHHPRGHTLCRETWVGPLCIRRWTTPGAAAGPLFRREHV